MTEVSLTVEQKAALDEFTMTLKNEGPTFPEEGPDSWFQFDERTLLGFLVARDYNVPKALKMIRESIEMRKKWKPHEISAKNEDVARGLAPGVWRIAGRSRQGYPVHLIEVRKFHPKDVESMDAFIRLLFYEYETGKRLCRETNWEVDRVVLIYDLSGFSMFDQGSPSGVKYTQALINVAQDNFPEHLQTIYMWNAPYLFRAFFSIIKPFLNEKVAAKIKFITDASAFQEYIEADALYKAFGGNKTDEYPVPDY